MRTFKFLFTNFNAMSFHYALQHLSNKIYNLTKKTFIYFDKREVEWNPIALYGSLFGIGDLNQHAKLFHYFPSIPFNRSPLQRPCTAGTSWRVQAPYMVRLVTGSWSYFWRSKLLIFNWVGGWDVYMGGPPTNNMSICKHRQIFIQSVFTSCEIQLY